MRRPACLAAAAVLVLAVGCGDGDDDSETEGAPTPRASAAAVGPGEPQPRCEQVVRAGQPVQTQLVRDGCERTDGTQVTFETKDCPDGRTLVTYEGTLRGFVGGTWEAGSSTEC